VTLAAALLALAVGPPSWAQQAPAANASNASAGQNTLQEIVVTAEKRSETVQATPMSVTAYSGAQLLAAGISDMSEVGYETPGCVGAQFRAGQTEYEMRGIASSAVRRQRSASTSTTRR